MDEALIKKIPPHSVEAERAVIGSMMMDKDAIEKVIKETLAELSIEKPTLKDKGAIIKTLMPKVKGKADGKLVNEVLASMM